MTNIIVLGRGGAGLITAKNILEDAKRAGLDDVEVTVIGINGGNSGMSHWNLNMEPPETIREAMISLLGPHPNRRGRSKRI